MLAGLEKQDGFKLTHYLTDGSVLMTVPAGVLAAAVASRQYGQGDASAIAAAAIQGQWRIRLRADWSHQTESRAATKADKDSN